MSFRRYLIPTLIALAIVAFVGRGLLHRGDYAVTSGAAHDSVTAFTNGRPNLVAATFYSAWCSACAVLDPKMRVVAPQFEGRAVEFTKFDFSLGQTDALTAKAEMIGIEDVYLENKGATGFVALVDRRTQRTVGQLYMGHSEDDIRADIESAILQVSKPLEADAS